MESTGGSATKSDRPSKELPKDHLKYIPSIVDQGLD
jgi:hypothetical protein